MTNNITAYTLSLISQAKAKAAENKIRKRELEKQQITEALDYIHANLDKWYAEHINKMETELEYRPLYFCVSDISDGYLHRLTNKFYKYSAYRFKAVEFPIRSVQGFYYLEVFVDG
jgi:hypothetical protein